MLRVRQKILKIALMFHTNELNCLAFTVQPIYKDVHLRFLPNRRGGMNLEHNGFLYTVERKYKSTINWVCNKNSNAQLRCPARCVTTDGQIRLSLKPHNHEAMFWVFHSNEFVHSLYRGNFIIVRKVIPHNVRQIKFKYKNLSKLIELFLLFRVIKIITWILSKC